MAKISSEEFDRADDLYKIIVNDDSNYFAYFELNKRKFYVSYFSRSIKVAFFMMQKEKILLVGIDEHAVGLCMQTCRILFSLGLFSFLVSFSDVDNIRFAIHCQFEDLIMNKNGFSISEIKSVDPGF